MKVLLFDFAGVLYHSRQGMNQELLTYLRQARAEQEIITAIFTNSSNLLQDPQLTAILEPVFDHFFLAPELNLAKDNPDSYRQLFARLQQPASTIFYTDDHEYNTQAAEVAGATTHVFTTTPLLLSHLSRFLNK